MPPLPRIERELSPLARQLVLRVRGGLDLREWNVARLRDAQRAMEGALLEMQVHFCACHVSSLARLLPARNSPLDTRVELLLYGCHSETRPPNCCRQAPQVRLRLHAPREGARHRGPGRQLALAGALCQGGREGGAGDVAPVARGARERSRVNAHEAFLCTLAELWHEREKWTHLDDFQLGIVAEEFGGASAVRVVASYFESGKARRIVGPAITLREVRTWEDLTQRLREVTERLPRAGAAAVQGEDYVK